MLPSLRDRDDFAVLVRRLLADAAPGRTLDPRALDLLAAWRWPGNVRELRSLLTRLTMDGSGQPITPAAVADMLRQVGAQTMDQASSLRDSVRGRIMATHRSTGGNVSETARRLGVSRNTIYRAVASG